MPTGVQDRQSRIAALGWDLAREPKRPVQSCNLCGGHRKVVIAHRDRYGFSDSASACLTCGLVFLDPVMTAEAYGRFYQTVYRPLVSAYHDRQIDYLTVQQEQEPYAAALEKTLEPYVRASGARTLLDVGGSTGVVAARLASAFQLEATVLDPAGLEIAQARRMGLKTIQSLLEDFEPEGDEYDLIVTCQTIDHLLDVAEALDKVRELLSQRGLFFVDIVDFRAAYLRHWSVEEAVKVDHPFYLTEPTMESFLSRHGFEILQKDYSSDHLHIGYLCGLGRSDLSHLPSSESVEVFFRELRLVQNAPVGSDRPGTITL